MATDLLTAPALGADTGTAATEPPRDQADGRVRHGRTALANLMLLILAALPTALGMRNLLQQRSDAWVPDGDIALFEMTVASVGRHEVLLGVYSRFGWSHPGPMEAYLLAIPYRLLDGSHQAIAIGALGIAGICSVGVVLLVRRHAGFVTAAWSLLILMVSVRQLGTNFIEDPWNPYVAVLPLLVGVILCWAAIRGTAWALPVAVIPLSLAVQCHVGYLAPVAAVGAVLAAGLLSRGLRRWPADRRRNEQRAHLPGRWLVAAFGAAEIALLLWLPPIIQQISGRPGNIGLLIDYVKRGPPDPTPSLGTALHAVANEFGKLPVYVTGGRSHTAGLQPEQWPSWAVTVGLTLFVAALITGALRRRGDVLWLGALTVAVAAAGVAAVSRIEGPPYTYTTRWTVVVGILAWIVIGRSLLPELVAVRSLLEPAAPVLRPDVVLGVSLTVLATTAALVTGIGVARAEPPFTDTTGETHQLSRGVIADLDRRGLRPEANPPVVRVDFAATTHNVLLGTYSTGAGIVLELVRAGVDVQLSDFWRLPFGQQRVDRVHEASYVVTVAYADGSSPPPEPWQQVLGVGPEFQVYGGVPPVG